MGNEQLKDELAFKEKVLSNRKSELYRAYILGRKELALEMSKSIEKLFKKEE